MASFFLALGGAALAADPGYLGQDLAGWWRMDEAGGLVADDSSGLGNDGALVGDVSFTDDALVGRALDFTDVSGEILVAHDPSLEPVTGTVEAWVKVSTPQNSDILVSLTDLLVRTGTPCGCGVIGLQIQADGSARGFVANNDPTTPLAPWREADSPPGLLTPHRWHHLALRWDGSDVAIFVDGILRQATPYDPVPGLGLSYNDGTGPYLGLGTTWAIPGPHEFIGQLDDVRLYGRPLPDREIFSTWASRGHRPARPPGR